jgi:tetratricopeptide (TPR) repeat protein
MKNLLLISVLILPLASTAQVIMVSTEPVQLYEVINNSLEYNKPKTALQSFKKVIAFYKQEGRSSELPEKYFGMALGLALNGYYKESIRYHKKAIRQHHRYREGEPLEISINLGLTYYLAGQKRKAKRILGDTDLTSL